ncbi:MAG: hypothetical protein KJP25_00760 [Gammaproteobacteria bacterium]|nr:hypothetical protein [Gammaproteobacteria bacterium]MBT8150740.1 hypothetical protein [Gammaproteobacteria bacterium]NND39743.1 hypothetical protein [Pseudomonadales bacterium]NNL11664.1 hypothetical protein [Pseudomonadales bacterium]RZV49565.1 MAG: hypothetical protein EX270_12450 [Pseudomonadales bacterium]
MKIVKRSAEYTIYQKRNQRYGVKGADKKWVNGDDKVKVLLAEGLVKAPTPKAPEPEPAPEADAGEADAAADDAAGDEKASAE